ncbi:PilZ domain-containing protein [Pseudobacteriovorax antillogorgiicola]|uniref:PilZ domain-containing protein n=1 Tax=Pseudobacteriovorax antillogorgiicola TaxID=1513793 RepID=A0A1Y6C7N0_9BACT|nr:PilZ domain-containing protein [Pseudobacteriovorax antillogorgiicola]TCS49444.1 PilZ domain-containing protein [Pseudobacteriovorax antillogorgiicola]SMF46553.1 PilZ domain-containing protein [Pseudobacteriovorax antillogorgiicola]
MLEEKRSVARKFVSLATIDQQLSLQVCSQSFPCKVRDVCPSGIKLSIPKKACFKLGDFVTLAIAKHQIFIPLQVSWLHSSDLYQDIGFRSHDFDIETVIQGVIALEIHRRVSRKRCFTKAG